MNILVLNGSPHKSGNTAKLVSRFRVGAERAGHEITELQVGTMNIRGCIGCEYCLGKGKGTCVFKNNKADDMERVYAALAKADMLVLASPIHYYGLSGQMQSCLARFHAVTKPPKATRYALILSSVDEDAAQAAELQFRQNVRYFEGQVSGIFHFHDANRDDEGLLRALEEFGAAQSVVR